MKISSAFLEGAREGAPFVFWDSFGASNERSGIGVYRKNLLQNLEQPGLWVSKDKLEFGLIGSECAGKLRVPWFQSVGSLVCSHKAQNKIIHGLCNYNIYPSLNAGVKTMLTVHDLIPLFEKVSKSSSFWYRAMFRKALERADCVVAISESTLRDIFNIYPQFVGTNKFFVVPNGSDHIGRTSLGVRRKPKPNNAIFISRFETYKGFDLLGKIINSDVDYKFDVVTCDRGEEYLRRALKIRGMEKTTIHKNLKHSQIKTLLESSSLFLHLSRREGFGLPFEEACFSLLPIVYVPCNAVDERADDRFHFRLSRDFSLESCLEKMASLTTSDIDFEQYNLYLEKKFTWKDSATLYQKLYNEM